MEGSSQVIQNQQSLASENSGSGIVKVKYLKVSQTAQIPEVPYHLRYMICQQLQKLRGNRIWLTPLIVHSEVTATLNFKELGNKNFSYANINKDNVQIV